jgi:predicted nucleic acid-binding protein
MRVYCDSSVLGDLLLSQGESRRIRDYLTSWQLQGTVATSRLTMVELGRLAMREGATSRGSVLDTAALPLEFIALGESVLRSAASLPVRFLRSLDAIHVASALLVQADVVLTRDHQIRRACEELGLAFA